jgi:gamma-glutamyl hercynylcysteine S-oxide hydrolase
MCRHLAYLGPPVSLYDLLYAPPHGLYRQSYAPRHQRHGTVNADGFGVGWFSPAHPEPLRYRRAGPIWADLSFEEASRAITATCVVAAVRDATPGTGTDECCAQPFRAEGMLFSHNGAAADGEALYERLAEPPVRGAPDARAPVDSAVLFAHAVRLMRGGHPLVAALGEVVRAARDICGGRFNLLASDGRTLAATVCGDSLYAGEFHGGVCLASEPFGPEESWRELPEGSVVTADGEGLRTGGLPGQADDGKGIVCASTAT